MCRYPLSFVVLCGLSESIAQNQDNVVPASAIKASAVSIPTYLYDACFQPNDYTATGQYAVKILDFFGVFVESRETEAEEFELNDYRLPVGIYNGTVTQGKNFENK